ncbi:MAG: hypothetical protein AAF567_00875 [Actinomycetota bacterium]
MSELTTTEAAEQTGKPILEYGRSWMMAPGTIERGTELGLMQLGMFGFWVNGRAGVLGDVDASLAASAIGFMAPEQVGTYWEGRSDELSAWDASLAWFEAAAEWGRATLASMPEDRVRRLADLARTLIDGADASIGALFTGSKLIPLPGDAAGDATVNLNVLRELRGCAHLAASHAVGLGPHAAIMSTDDPIRGGVNWSETFGWTAPHPEPNPDARIQAEAITTVAMSRVFESLSGAERSEFAGLVAEARAAVPD